MISAAMIVRDEAAVLGACLASISAEVDEIVIVDTGSTDDTIAIAEAHGARVIRSEWRQDFATPRNLAIDAATGDWILYIDADERLSVPRPGVLREAADASLAGVKLKLQPRRGFTAYHEYRLFRRDPRIRFRGRIHERVGPGLYAMAEAEGLGIGECDALLSHVGYEGDLTRKHARNLPMLREAVKEEPTRIYCWCHLGETLMATGDLAGAEAALGEAIRLSLARHHSQEIVEGSLAREQLVILLRKQGRDPLPAIEDGLAAMPDNHALRLMKARALVEHGREAEALAILDDLAATDADSFFEPRLAFDKRIFGLFAEELAGLARFRLGDFARAAEHYRRAFAESGAIEHSVKARLADAKAGRAA